MDKLHSSVIYGSNSSEEWFNSIYNYIDSQNCNPVYGSLIGSLIVGLSGVFPLLIPLDGALNVSTKTVGGERLKLLLSFAIGGLLGDVFLHLLPEAWNNHLNSLPKVSGTGIHPSTKCGMWVLTGLLVFLIVEKLCQTLESDVKPGEEESTSENNNVEVKTKENNHKDVSGYLNLMANVIDNFTHGMAVGGSFLFSWRVGFITTVAILVHEVPHELGDFAILLRAGFTKGEAAKAQLATASSSLLGATAAVVYNSQFLEEKTSWILPFSAGGFLHIALVSLLPELIQEECPKQSMKQLVALMFGVLLMATLTAVIEG
uniref:Uncharacterized protein CG7816 n=2 Tax=Lygus hesperus TaxID=30085 RepID=A0A146L978_LYGHE